MRTIHDAKNVSYLREVTFYPLPLGVLDTMSVWLQAFQL